MPLVCFFLLSCYSENAIFLLVSEFKLASKTCYLRIQYKQQNDRSFLGKLFMRYFFHRYRTLEKANFPIATRENAICLSIITLSLLIQLLDITPFSQWTIPLFQIPFPTLFLSTALFTSLFTTFVATAPIIGRITPIHRWYLWFVQYPLFRVMESIPWCTGTNKHGYIMHLTAPKLLGYGYVTPEQMDNICSLAIVRNPYSRMVSIYGYNRFGEMEDFKTFMRRWKKLMKPYLEDGEKEEWYTPCHLLPQFEYTHYNGKQLVQSVVKQEELKYLKTRDGAEEAIKLDNSVSDLPKIVREALLGMPHTNKRATSKKWYDYYDQETLNLTYDMYKLDFDVFGYEIEMKQRPDLKPPRPSRRDDMQAMKFDRFSRDSFMSRDGKRMSQASIFNSVRDSVKLNEVLTSMNNDNNNVGSIGASLRRSAVAGRTSHLLRSVVEREETSESFGDSSHPSKKDD
mmetsp:Transcript_24061/g.49224  ORF Transcript_24061/g.49224 Transcript_24061/m.49224 type:complete len:456 (+) Transcript_24061:54-1421(+)